MSKRDKSLAREFHGKPCVVCGATETTVGDHILTVGSRPDLAANRKNIWALCWIHHDEKGRSLREFVAKYQLQSEMILRGFFECEMTKNWRMK